MARSRLVLVVGTLTMVGAITKMPSGTNAVANDFAQHGAVLCCGARCEEIAVRLRWARNLSDFWFEKVVC